MGKSRYRLARRGSVWYAYVYENGARRQVSTRCTDLKAAELSLRQLERDFADPAHAAAQKATLSDALKLLLDRRTEEATVGRRSHETVAFYRRKAGHLTRIFEHLDDGKYAPFLLAGLRAADVDQYISRRRSEAVTPAGFMSAGRSVPRGTDRSSFVIRHSRASSRTRSSTHRARNSSSPSGATSAAIFSPPASRPASRHVPQMTCAAPTPSGCDWPASPPKSSLQPWATGTPGWSSASTAACRLRKSARC